MYYKLIYSISLLICLIITNASLADTLPLTHIGRLPIQTWTTDKGTRVFFVRSSELPILDLRLIFSAGSTIDQNQWGLANLTNAVLMTGTKAISADQIATQFDQLGVSLINDVNQDYAVVGLRSLSAPQSLDPAIKLLTQILAAPNFPSDQFSRLQKQNLRVIQANQQAPGSVANDKLFKSLYGKHGYGHPVLGNAQTVTALTRNDLINFYQHYYTAKKTSLVLVGNISDVQAKTIAAQLSAVLPTKQSAPLPRIAITQQIQTGCQQVNFPSAQANIFIGSLGIARNDPDFFPLIVGNHIVGGSALTSRLFQEVRNKKGLAYSVYSGFMPLKEPGPFLINLQSRNEKANEAIQTTQETLSKFIQEGPTNEELTSAKHNLIGKFNVNLASNGAITNALSSLAFYQLPLDYFDNYARKIQEVTAQQVQAAMQKHVHLDQLLTVMVGKATCGTDK